MEQKDHHISPELVCRFKEGDKAAFDLVYRQFSHKLFTFIRKILKNESDTEEIVQEVFVRLWEARSRIDTSRSLYSWLFTIAYNLSVDLIRKRLNDQKYAEHLRYAAMMNSASVRISDPEFNELWDRLQELIEKLPDRQRQIYRLHRESGLTYGEIAEQLGISRNTVENHMARALAALRRGLGYTLLIHFYLLRFSFRIRRFIRVKPFGSVQSIRVSSRQLCRSAIPVKKNFSAG